MIVSIHQPHFLPWMGYFNKVLHSDVFVWLHSVQFRKNYFQNRTRIRDGREAPMWLTLPVHARLESRIDEVGIADSGWRKRVTKTVEQCYRQTAHFDAVWPPLAEALNKAADRLDDVNWQTFISVLRILGVDSRVVRAGDLPATSADPTQRLVELCRAAGATKYIAGKGGRNYLRVEEFDRAGIDVIWQDFDAERVVYSQAGPGFVPGLSIIDSLFNVGSAATGELVRGAWVPGDSA